MQWNEYTVVTTPIGVEFILGILIENDITSVQELDDASIRFYLEQDDPIKIKAIEEDIEELRHRIDIGSGSISKKVTREEEWIDNWKEFFKPVVIEDVLIWPSWQTKPQDIAYDTCIEIDPGTTFGTGGHETTQLCIRQLKKVLQENKASKIEGEDARKNNCKVLDVGCGSGILSLVALKYGADKVVGVDIDEKCRLSSSANMVLNNLDEHQAEWLIGNLMDQGAQGREIRNRIMLKPFEVVVANMLTDITMPMLPLLHEALKPEGIFITSGIIDFKEEQMKQGLVENGFRILQIQRLGEWVGITARRV